MQHDAGELDTASRASRAMTLQTAHRPRIVPEDVHTYVPWWLDGPKVAKAKKGKRRRKAGAGRRLLWIIDSGGVGTVHIRRCVYICMYMYTYIEV